MNTIICELAWAYSKPRELTLATGLHALDKAVFRVFVVGSSAFLVPSTTRSATTDFAGFLERGALWAHRGISNR